MARFFCGGKVAAMVVVMLRYGHLRQQLHTSSSRDVLGDLTHHQELGTVRSPVAWHTMPHKMAQRHFNGRIGLSTYLPDSALECACLAVGRFSWERAGLPALSLSQKK